MFASLGSGAQLIQNFSSAATLIDAYGGDDDMAAQDATFSDVVKQALRDAQDLVRSEIALAKAEARAEVSRLAVGAGLIAAGIVTAAIGLVLLTFTFAWAISEELSWPVWAGFGIVTIAMLTIAAIFGFVGKRRLTAARHMPRTVDTLKENMQWMRTRMS